MTIRRRRLLLAPPALALAGCAGLGVPRTITLGEADLAARLAREFPLERRVLDLFDLRLEAPTIALRPDANRLAFGMPLSAVERLRGGRRSGRIDFDTALRWDAATDSLRLSQVRVQALAVDGLSGQASGLLDRIGRVVAEQWLEDLPVYTLREKDRQRLASAGLAPASVAVTSGGIEIGLSPSR